MRFLLSFPLPLLLILISFVSFESQAAPFDAFNPQEPTSGRLNRRSAIDPPPSGTGGSASAVNYTDVYKDLSPDEVKRELKSEKKKLEDLGKERDDVNRTVIAMQENVTAATQDYEDKKKEWEKWSEFNKWTAESQNAKDIITEKEAEIPTLNATVAKLEQKLELILRKVKNAEQEVEDLKDIDNVLAKAKADADRYKQPVIDEEAKKNALNTIKTAAETKVKDLEINIKRYELEFNDKNCGNYANVEIDPCKRTIATLKTYKEQLPIDRKSRDEAISEYKKVEDNYYQLELNKTTADKRVYDLESAKTDLPGSLMIAEGNLRKAKSDKAFEEKPLTKNKELLRKAEEDLANATLTKSKAEGILKNLSLDAKTEATAFIAQNEAEKEKSKLEDELTKLQGVLKEKEKECNATESRVNSLQKLYNANNVSKGGGDPVIIIIIVAVVLTLIIVGCVVGGVLFYNKRKARRQNDDVEQQNGGGHDAEKKKGALPGGPFGNWRAKDKAIPSATSTELDRIAGSVKEKDVEVKPEPPESKTMTRDQLPDHMKKAIEKEYKGGSLKIYQEKKTVCLRFYIGNGRCKLMVQGEFEDGTKWTNENVEYLPDAFNFAEDYRGQYCDMIPDMKHDGPVEVCNCKDFNWVFFMKQRKYRSGAGSEGISIKVFRRKLRPWAILKRMLGIREGPKKEGSPYPDLEARRELLDKNGGVHPESEDEIDQDVDVSHSSVADTSMSEAEPEPVTATATDNDTSAAREDEEAGAEGQRDPRELRVPCEEQQEAYANGDAWPMERLQGGQDDVVAQDVDATQATVTEAVKPVDKDEVVTATEIGKGKPEVKVTATIPDVMPEKEPAAPKEESLGQQKEEEAVKEVTATAGNPPEQDSFGDRRRGRVRHTSKRGSRGSRKSSEKTRKSKKTKKSKKKKSNKEKGPRKASKESNRRSSSKRKGHKRRYKDEESEPSDSHADSTDKTTTLFGRIKTTFTDFVSRRGGGLSEEDLDDLIASLSRYTIRSETLALQYDDYCDVLELSKGVFYDGKRVIETEMPANIVTDIHGDIFGLMKMFKAHSGRGRAAWTFRKFIFCGDYVDRGGHSVQVMMLLLCLKLRHPDWVILLRGNHEDDEVNKKYGFHVEIRNIFGTEGEGLERSNKLIRKFNEVFERMPLCAILSKVVFCCHGGLTDFGGGDLVAKINTISKVLKYPLKDPIAVQLLWADPCRELSGFYKNYLRGGIGLLFGSDIVAKLCNDHGIDLVVRGHQAMGNGQEWFSGERLLSLFSSAGYDKGNIGATISFAADGRFGLKLYHLTNKKTLEERKEEFVEVFCYRSHTSYISSLSQNLATKKMLEEKEQKKNGGQQDGEKRTNEKTKTPEKARPEDVGLVEPSKDEAFSVTGLQQEQPATEAAISRR